MFAEKSKLKNKMFADLPIKQQLEFLKRKNIRRGELSESEDENDEEVPESESEQENEEKEGNAAERVNSKKTAEGASSVEEGQNKVEQRTKHPIKLQLDKLSDEHTHVAFGKMERLAKISNSFKIPRYKRSEVTRYL